MMYEIVRIFGKGIISMDNKGDFLAGVVVGAVMGAVVGILFAPASGRETRERIAEKGREVKEQAVDTARETKEEITNTSKELLDKLKDKLPQSKDVQKVLEDAEKELSR